MAVTERDKEKLRAIASAIGSAKSLLACYDFESPHAVDLQEQLLGAIDLCLNEIGRATT